MKDSVRVYMIQYMYGSSYKGLHLSNTCEREQKLIFYEMKKKDISSMLSIIGKTF